MGNTNRPLVLVPDSVVILPTLYYKTLLNIHVLYKMIHLNLQSRNLCFEDNLFSTISGKAEKEEVRKTAAMRPYDLSDSG